MQRLRDPGLLAQAVSRSARQARVRMFGQSDIGPQPGTAPTLLSLVGAFILLVLVIATAAWVPA